VTVEEKDLSKQFADVLHPAEDKPSTHKKTSLWKKMSGKN